MAVSIDNVYQKVLALANKEQRGYITPQDFNLFASQAQLEIFEQYFYDLNQARRSQGNDTVIADIDNILEDKLGMFEYTAGLTDIATYTNISTGGKELPEQVYRVLRVTLNKVECELLNTRDFINCKGKPLTKPSKKRPIANIQSNVIKCNSGQFADENPTSLTYIYRPSKPNWTYAVINKQAMYNHTGNTNNFDLHASEEIQLVNKILRLAGLATQQPDVVNAGVAMETAVIQQKQI